VSSFWLYSEAIAETDRGFDVALDHAAHAVLAFVANENRENCAMPSPAKESTWRRSINLHGRADRLPGCADPEAAFAYRSPGAPANLSRVGTIVDSHSSARTARIPGRYRSPQRTVLRRSMSRNRSKSADAVANAVALKLLAPGARTAGGVLALTIGWTVRAAAEPLIRYSRDLDRLAPAHRNQSTPPGCPTSCSRSRVRSTGARAGPRRLAARNGR